MLPDIHIRASTRYCAVLGHPVRHSASPSMQNAGIHSLGLDWRYLAFEVHPKHLSETIEGAKAMGFIGLNLTIPHKQSALEKVDVLAACAQEWGAINTIAFEGLNAEGTWKSMACAPADSFVARRSIGYNTDASAILHACREDLQIDFSKARILLLGAGGAGYVAALKMASIGIVSLHIVNRTIQKARRLREIILQKYPRCEVHLGYPKNEIDLIINSTSLGLQKTDPCPVDLNRFSLNAATAVYDMIYRATETPLLKEAKSAGCRVANGLGMLVFQGAKALEIWSGQKAPMMIMRSALEQHLYGSRRLKTPSRS